MDENRRQSARYNVSLYVEQIEREEKKVRILNLSSSGFLVRGEICAGQGGIFHASFRAHPSAGDVRVSIRGTVVHARSNGLESEYGIKIDSFGSPAEESAYQAYVRELAARAARSDGIPSKGDALQIPSRNVS
jgi:hypothetical protein